MANLALPGFQPGRRSGGDRITYVRRRVLTNNTLAINLNDAVVTDTNGNTLQASTTTTAVASVSGGASYVDANGVRVGAKGLPAATLYTSSGVQPENASYVFIVDGVGEVDFIASITTALTKADINTNTSFVAGTGTNGISAQTLDSAGIAATATLPFRIMDFVEAPDNDADAATAHVYCRINASMYEPLLETGGSLGLA
jgi:hypothetical protein